MEKERRKHKRVKKTMAVQIEDSYGMLLDLSKGGMRIIPDLLPKKFDDIRISFISESGELIEVWAAIVRIADRKKKEGKYELGLRITKKTPNFSNYLNALEKNESPSGIFQDNVRQDLVKAVLEGKQEDLSIPRSETTYIPPSSFPPETQPRETVNIPLEEILDEDDLADFPELSPTAQEPASDETVEMPLENISRESQAVGPSQSEIPQPNPAVPGENTPPGTVDIPLEELMEEEPQPQTPEPLPPRESLPDEMIIMPPNRLPYQAPNTANSAKLSNDKKKAAPQRIEISYEEFLQKNPQFNKPIKTPPLPQKPPPVDESSLDIVFKEAPTAQPLPPGLKEDELSLNGLFSDNQQPAAPAADGGVQEEDTSLDNLFFDQGEKE